MDEISLSLVRDVLKFSLSAPLSTHSALSATKEPDSPLPDDPGKDPRVHKLVEALLFSRQLLLTYNVVLLIILSVCTICHWREDAREAWRRRGHRAGFKDKSSSLHKTPGEAWSSSSSETGDASRPLSGASPGWRKHHPVDERSPLMVGHQAGNKVRMLWRPYFVWRSWMQYQPSPIPVVNKTLPPNSISLFVVAFLALNAFYNLYGVPFQMFYLFVFADRCGMLFVANLPLLYLLSAKNQPIKFLTGYSYESLNIFHRRVGELLCFEALLHFAGMIMVWYGLLRRLGFTFERFLFSSVVELGLGAFVAYQVLYLTSLGGFRRKFYETFLTTHIVLQLAGLVLVFFHHRQSRPYVAISLAIFVVDRIVFRFWMRSSSYPATLTVLEDGETILLSSDWDVKHRPYGMAPRSMAQGWKPNDHVFLTVLSLPKKYSLQAHPFTIFSAAPNQDQASADIRASGSTHAWFSVLIRAQDDDGFTRALLEHAYQNCNIQIRLDGPYGSSNALRILESSENAIIIAGGSGIAVAYPLLWALLHPGAISSDAEPGKAKINRRKVKLLWVTHARSHRYWLPEEKLQELQDWGLQVLLPAPSSEAGRPDVRKLLTNWIEGDSTGIVVSGPEGLVRDVRNASAKLIKDGELVSVDVEKFGW